jgi:hypothetical protein
MKQKASSGRFKKKPQVEKKNIARLTGEIGKIGHSLQESRSGIGIQDQGGS